MANVVPNLIKPSKRLTVQCRGLSLELSNQVGLRIAVRRYEYLQREGHAQKNDKPRILPLAPNSGPFFVYADPEQTGQNNRIDRRFSVVGLQHHKKMDHA
jgi:hypothetical protein